MPINNCRTSVSIKLCVFFLLHYVSTLKSSPKMRPKSEYWQQILATVGHSMLYWNRDTIICKKRLEHDSNEGAEQM
jgi:cytochrome b561